MTNSTHFILLGASGDLAHKKILPALVAQGSLDITLWSRKKLDYQLPSSYNIIQSDYTDQEVWEGVFATHQSQHLIVYMALPPVSYLDILKVINWSLIIKACTIHIVIEKPFATDSANMNSIIEFINSSSRLGGRVHFFDHFLFKDILVRLNNEKTPSEPLKSVVVRSLETIDVIGRAAFYDRTGATRDMISHLMFFGQKFCQGMGYGEHFDWDKYKITRYETAQYPGYNDNPELLGKASSTETFFDLELSNPDLAPSTIRLISGKKQPQKIWDIAINNTTYDLTGISTFEHLNMIKALESKDYSRFVTANQALEMWRLIGSLGNFGSGD